MQVLFKIIRILKIPTDIIFYPETQILSLQLCSMYLNLYTYQILHKTVALFLQKNKVIKKQQI